MKHESKSWNYYLFDLKCEKLIFGAEVQKMHTQKWIVVTTGLLLHSELSAIK